MTKLRFIILALITGLTLAFAGCGGGGSGSSAVNNDRDGDGIPNAEDAFPDDATRFAAFTRVDLAQLAGGAFSAALDVNDAASPMIVGTADQNGVIKAAKWSVTDSTPSAPIILAPIGENSYSAAFANNDSGAAVGESAKELDFVPVHWAADAVVPSELKLTETVSEGDPPVETVAVLGTSGAAYGINNAGQIAGEIKRADGSLMGAVWNNADAEPLELPSLGGASASAYFISNAGWVVGESMTAEGLMRATLWQVSAAGTVIGSPIDLGILTGHARSIALAVDNEERIVGESEDDNGTVHAVLWSPEAAGAGFTMTDLGTNASAQAINDGNHIAGYAGLSPVAAVWDTRLTDPTNFTAVLEGTGFSQAYGLNQGSMVVGIAGDQGFVALPQ